MYIFLFLHVLKSLLKGFCWNCYLPKRKFSIKNICQNVKKHIFTSKNKDKIHMRGFNNISSHSSFINIVQCPLYSTSSELLSYMIVSRNQSREQISQYKMFSELEKVSILVTGLVFVPNLIWMDIILCPGVPQQF